MLRVMHVAMFDVELCYVTVWNFKKYLKYLFITLAIGLAIKSVSRELQ